MRARLGEARRAIAAVSRRHALIDPVNFQRLYRQYVELRATPAAIRAWRIAGSESRCATAPRFALGPLLRRLYSGSGSVLDAGTGIMNSLRGVPVPVRIGLDAHRPYLENRVDSGAVPINAAASELERLFVPNAVDLVTAMDVIEHFDRDAAIEFLRQAEQIAARRVVLFTPRGHFPQTELDIFGLGGEELQRHRSEWEPTDLLQLGYRVVVLDGYHGPWNSSFVETFGADAPPTDALLAWKTIAAA